MTRTNTAADIMRRKVADLERSLKPGVNRFLTRDMWDALVMAAAFEVLNDRLMRVEEDERQAFEITGHHEPVPTVSANDVLTAARAELARSYDGLMALV
jgi:hypothetical protein